MMLSATKDDKVKNLYQTALGYATSYAKISSYFKMSL